MLTVILECNNQESLLAQTLSALVGGAVDGLVREVVILDHGSKDGSLAVADAAGCRIYQHWKLADVITAARGSWIMLLEPGARPQPGWIEEVAEYLAVGDQTARFSRSAVFAKPLWVRLVRRVPAYESGFIISKRAALENAVGCDSLADLAVRRAVRTLRAQIIPSWVLAERT